jgi:hypothetical protein
MPRWAFQTKSGLTEIVPLRVDQFALLFDGEPLENHATPAAAAEAISNGTCSWPSVGDPSELGIPAQLSEWTFIP